MTPNPAFLFLTPRHREALAGLTYAILERKGLVVVIGEAGTGKTTLLARFLEGIPDHWLRAGVILNPTLTPVEFLEALLLSFGISEIPPTKPRRLQVLENLLLEAWHTQKVCALLVDEAHKLTPELLEEIRLIGNMEHNCEKLLQIILLGQSDLASTLNREDLRQLKQRIALRLTIGALDNEDVVEYIQHRWLKAGATGPAPFHEDAVEMIKRASSGIPRSINAICDNALLLAYARNQRIVTPEHILTVCTDLDLTIPVHTNGSNGHKAFPSAAAATALVTAEATAPAAYSTSKISTPPARSASSLLVADSAPAAVRIGVAVPVEPESIRLREVPAEMIPKRKSWLRRLFKDRPAAESKDKV